MLIKNKENKLIVINLNNPIKCKKCNEIFAEKHEINETISICPFCGGKND